MVFVACFEGEYIQVKNELRQETESSISFGEITLLSASW